VQVLDRIILLQPMEHRRQAEQLPVEPHRSPADRSEAATLVVHAPVDDVILDAVEFIRRR
jgi:PIN domain nuclease of toxin-antitoxin system